MSDFTPYKTSIVSQSAHIMFWDLVHAYPLPEGAKSKKFYASLGKFLLHIMQCSGVLSNRMVGSVPIPRDWIQKNCRYLYDHTSFKEEFIPWLRDVAYVFDYCKRQHKCREFEFKPEWINLFLQANLIDESLYDLHTENRRKPLGLNMKDYVSRQMVDVIKPRKIVRPKNFNRKNKELNLLLKQAEANQVPYRLKLDRYLGLLKNLEHNGAVDYHVQMKNAMFGMMSLGVRIVDDKKNDRVVEFYDLYKMNPTGSRLFGRAQAMPKFAKYLCCAAGTNYDMPRAQLKILTDILDERQIDCSMLKELDHSKMAQTLKVSRGLSKKLTFGGLFKGWTNLKYFKTTIDGIEKMHKAPLYRALVRDLCDEQKADIVWTAWKEAAAPARLAVTDLCNQLMHEQYTRKGISHFQNSMGCSLSVEKQHVKKRRYSILSHVIQGQESRNLLSVLATNKWHSAEFDGAIICGDYNQVVPMKEKPFCVRTDAILLFEYCFGTRRDFNSLDILVNDKRVSPRITEDTVNNAYTRLRRKAQQRKKNHGCEQKP